MNEQGIASEHGDRKGRHYHTQKQATGAIWYSSGDLAVAMLKQPQETEAVFW